MIRLAHNVAVVDLEPLHWRRLGELYTENLPAPPAVTVLHRSGRLVRVVGETGGVSVPTQVDDPAALARALHEAVGGRAQVADLDVLPAIVRAVHSFPHPTDDILGHEARVWNVVQGAPGCAVCPPPTGWAGLTRADVEAWLSSGTGTTLFVLTDGPAVWASLALTVADGAIVKVTTLDQPDLPVEPEALAALGRARFGTPLTTVVVPVAAAKAWLRSADKSAAPAGAVVMREV